MPVPIARAAAIEALEGLEQPVELARSENRYERGHRHHGTALSGAVEIWTRPRGVPNGVVDEVGDETFDQYGGRRRAVLSGWRCRKPHLEAFGFAAWAARPRSGRSSPGRSAHDGQSPTSLVARVGRAEGGSLAPGLRPRSSSAVDLHLGGGPDRRATCTKVRSRVRGFAVPLGALKRRCASKAASRACRGMHPRCRRLFLVSSSGRRGEASYELLEEIAQAVGDRPDGSKDPAGRPASWPVRGRPRGPEQSPDQELVRRSAARCAAGRDRPAPPDARPLIAGPGPGLAVAGHGPGCPWACSQGRHG